MDAWIEGTRAEIVREGDVSIDLRLGDCLDLMPAIPDASIDAVIADIPYGTTDCKWDTVIPFAPMWAQLKRITKKNAAIVLFGSQPFTSALVMSNPKMFRYEWIWEKSLATGYLNANRAPMKAHENLSVFSENGHLFVPQKTRAKPYRATRGAVGDIIRDKSVGGYLTLSDGFRFPRSVIPFNSEADTEHGTQKPVALMSYLIRTYTNEGDTVLDFTCGSGSTLVACVQTNRNGIGIEKDAGYFAVTQRRVHEAQLQIPMPLVTA